MRNKPFYVPTIVLMACVALCIVILITLTNKLNELNNNRVLAITEIESLISENKKLKDKMLEMENEFESRDNEENLQMNMRLGKYVEALGRDDVTSASSIESIQVKDNVVYFNGQSFQKEDPLQIDDEYYELMYKFFQLYEIAKPVITDQVLKEAGFDPWFIHAYGFSPFIDLRFNAKIISQEYLYKRSLLELSIQKYRNGENTLSDLDLAMEEFLDIREIAIEILSSAASADI